MTSAVVLDNGTPVELTFGWKDCISVDTLGILPASPTPLINRTAAHDTPWERIFDRGRFCLKIQVEGDPRWRISSLCDKKIGSMRALVYTSYVLHAPSALSLGRVSTRLSLLWSKKLQWGETVAPERRAQGSGEFAAVPRPCSRSPCKRITQVKRRWLGPIFATPAGYPVPRWLLRAFMFRLCLLGSTPSSWRSFGLNSLHSVQAPDLIFHRRQSRIQVQPDLASFGYETWHRAAC